MTITDKINLIGEKDNTVIEKVSIGIAKGYIVTTDEDTIVFASDKELEDWMDYQIASDPAYYGISLNDWYHTCSNIACNDAAKKAGRDYLGFKIFDNISGENLTETLEYSDWNIAKVDGIEYGKEYISLYVSIGE